MLKQALFTQLLSTVFFQNDEQETFYKNTKGKVKSTSKCGNVKKGQGYRIKMLS